ncbi:MAG: nuclear transport factor 2 family protein [Tepidiformaceae bacterium]
MSLSIEDQLGIQRLYARYNHAIDAGRGEEWAATFTAEGVFSSANGTFAGTEKLAGFATGFAQQIKGRHWTNNLLLDGDAKLASGTCYLMLLRLSPGERPPATILATAVYNDELVNEGGEWRFSKRTVTTDA